MKKFLALFFCFFSLALFSQTMMPYGSITLKSGAKFDFINLRIDGDNVTFNDVATNKNMVYPFDQVQSMQGKVLNAEEAAKAEAARKAAAIAVKADVRFRPGYPNGIYKTMTDFVNKTPSSSEKISIASFDGYDEYITDSEAHCFFRYDATGNKVKNVFAVSFNGFLYFQLEAILKNRNKTDRAQSNERYNQFVRVMDGGENYYYLEAELANQWSQGLAYGAVGGVAGYALAQTAVADKGIVWDFKNKEFNIFKNCKDFKDFIKDKAPESEAACHGNFPELNSVRRIIAKIK